MPFIIGGLQKSEKKLRKKNEKENFDTFL